MAVADWDRSRAVNAAIAMRRWRRYLQELVALALPDCCQLCDALIPARIGGGICSECVATIKRVENGCHRCGAPIPSVVGPVERCVHCRRGRWPAARIYGMGVYQGTLAKAVVLMKQPGSEPLARSLGRLMGKWLDRFPNRADWDAIFPTPKHWVQRLARVHNSAELLAESAGAVLGTPVDRHGLVRVRSTAKQGTLMRHERAANVAGAFRAANAQHVRGKRLLVIDDILTTGATAAEMASVLYAAGAVRVDVACLARGIGQRIG